MSIKRGAESALNSNNNIMIVFENRGNFAHS